MARWHPDNLAGGSAAEIRVAAGQWEQDAALARTGAMYVAGAPSESWAGAAGDAVRERAEFFRVELEALGAQTEAESRVLHRYAVDVDTIQNTFIRLRRVRESTQHEAVVLQRSLETAAPLADPATVAAMQARIQTLAYEVRRYDAQLEEWGERRRRANAAVLEGLSSPASRRLWTTYHGSVAGVVTLEELSQLSEMEIATLVHLDPLLIDTIASSRSPKEVAQWWHALSVPQQETLLRAAPTLIGSLGGLPPLVRVAANRLNALHALRALQAQAVDRPQGWKKRQKYLQRVVDGKVQLYLYQPEEERIVEMIGTPGADTSHVVTYVPGTFSNQDSFYGGDVQKVSIRLHEWDKSIVMFVWHGAEFPGQTLDPGDGAGLDAANEPALALATGARMAKFAAELTADGRLDGAHRQAIGHSWGLAAIAGSEVAGARYDNVVSLSGAWMPAEWRPVAGTDYAHYTYFDFLSVAKGIPLSLVGGGNVPDTSAAFSAPLGNPIPLDNDILIPVVDPYTSTQMMTQDEPLVMRVSGELTANHTLIASDDPANEPVLHSVLERFGE